MSRDDRLVRLIEDLCDPDDRENVLALMEGKPREDQVIEEARLSREEEKLRDAIAKETASKMEVFWKGTVVVGYIDLRRQIKATQRELADLRRQIDKQSKQIEKIPDIAKNVERINRGVEAMLVIPRGFDFRSIKQRQRDRLAQEMETYRLVGRIAEKVGVT